MTRSEIWNGIRQFGDQCHYLELVSTLNPVDVKLFGVNGQVLADDRQVEAGYYHDRTGLDPIARFDITTSTNEAVKFLTSDGRTGTRRSFVYQAQARTIALPGSVAVGVAEGAVLAAAARAKVIFRADAANAGVIALGPAGVTTANAPILLGPGDMWIEEVAASAAWQGIATVAAQTLRVMTAV